MQRWWYLDNKVKAGNQSERRLPSKSIEVNDGGGERKFLFRVLVTQNLNSFESVCVTGECSALGNWIPQHCVLLQKEDGKKHFSLKINFYFHVMYFFCTWLSFIFIEKKTPVF